MLAIADRAKAESEPGLTKDGGQRLDSLGTIEALRSEETCGSVTGVVRKPNKIAAGIWRQQGEEKILRNIEGKRLRKIRKKRGPVILKRSRGVMT